jgi:hypothetical protein
MMGQFKENYHGQGKQQSEKRSQETQKSEEEISEKRRKLGPTPELSPNHKNA